MLRSSALVLCESRELVNEEEAAVSLAPFELAVGDARGCVNSGVSRFRLKVPGEALLLIVCTLPPGCDMMSRPVYGCSMSLGEVLQEVFEEVARAEKMVEVDAEGTRLGQRTECRPARLRFRM